MASGTYGGEETEFWWRSLEERDHLEYLVVDEKILKCILNGVAWLWTAFTSFTLWTSGMHL